ncbi:hypothetical protein [Rhodococcus sp. 14-2470-1a]|uniref:hypothetical protein n=1 Tax=Rhodococcus sp. 14-2470-1a TaxID=2023150 RepID=UPI000B9AC057|nr:hypothetical protein [Rhodococcus sp. 14-2470-1a]OZF42090.1 hypothetical protein CH292_26730 [Rhodococcus sp. 14-2470-1a]
MTTHHESIGHAGELFARWPVTFDPPTRRIVDPPQPVIVSVSHALPGSPRTSLRDGTPLRVRAEGLSVDIKVQGTLSAWARLANGAWLARVDFSVPTGNGKGHLDLHGQWVPSDAITPMR